MPYLHTGEPAHLTSAPTESGSDEAERIESLNFVLTEWFSQHRDMQCFLVVDPSQRDLVSDDADDIGPFASLPRADLVIDHEEFPNAHQPYLLKLDLSSPAGIRALAQSIHIAFEDRRPESMAEGMGQRIGGWLASPAALEDVAAHWSRIVLQRDGDGRACVLRFYDSRAKALLWSVLSHTQQQAMLGPVKAWHALDACATPCIHLASYDAHAHFILSAEQWQAIHRHGLVNRALALHARACGRQPEPDQIDAAIHAAARSEQHGLIDRDDRVAFIGHSLAWHPQFDLHPKVYQLLNRRTADDFYTSEIEKLSTDEIDDIRRGSWYTLPADSPSLKENSELHLIR
jgi:hypothetical protein